jgi:Recombinase
VIYEPEAAIVRRIFADFLAGRGQRQIARDLVEDGIAAQRGGTWHQGTIGRLLTNPLYRGAVRLNGEVYGAEHEPIVDPERWEKAHQLRRALARTEGGGRGPLAARDHALRANTGPWTAPRSVDTF